MRATGYVRAMDELGRVVLPIGLRRELEIEPKDGVEIYVNGEDIILRKYLPSCVFCGEHEGLDDFRGRLVCGECRTTIAKAFGSAAD